ncbi:MAG TPA: class I SAM-dependent methyltransferase, partial [Bacilli bacterium]
SDSFDVVIAESVTVFVNPLEAFEEYFRVLRVGGQVWDRELYKIKHHPDLDTEMCKLYGSPHLPYEVEWIRMMNNAGFPYVWSWKPQNELPYLRVENEIGKVSLTLTK